MVTYIVLFMLAGLVDGKLRVGVVDDENTFILLNKDTTCQKDSSFECELLDRICSKLNQECEIVELPNNDARITYLQNQEVNFTLSKISVSQERADIVHFVRPYYYYAGAVIFQLNDTEESDQLGWSDVEGVRLCAQEDYYAIPVIEFLYKPEIVKVKAGESFQNLQEGNCSAIIKDSTDRLAGLVKSSKTKALFGAPYAIAVSKKDALTLGKQISNALVRMMNQWNQSEIFEIENVYLEKTSAVIGSQRLYQVVEAISEVNGPIPDIVEDAIWNQDKNKSDVHVCRVSY